MELRGFEGAMTLYEAKKLYRLEPLKAADKCRACNLFLHASMAIRHKTFRQDQARGRSLCHRERVAMEKNLHPALCRYPEVSTLSHYASGYAARMWPSEAAICVYPSKTCVYPTVLCAYIDSHMCVCLPRHGLEMSERRSCRHARPFKCRKPLFAATTQFLISTGPRLGYHNTTYIFCRFWVVKVYREMLVMAI